MGARYREATRARSTAEFISKIEGGLQELEETLYWLELLIESKIISSDKLNNLYVEAGEILAMMVSSVKTVKKNR